MTGGVVMDRTMVCRYVHAGPRGVRPFKSCHRLFALKKHRETSSYGFEMIWGWFEVQIFDDCWWFPANTCKYYCSSLCFASCLPHCLDQVAAAAATGALLWPGSVARQAGQPVRVRWDTIGIQWYRSGFWLTCWTSCWRVCFFSPWFSQ